MNLSEELDSIYKEAIQKIGSSISEEDLDKNKTILSEKRKVDCGFKKRCFTFY